MSKAKGKSASVCSECGGERKGRGYAHSAKCSKADPRTRRSRAGKAGKAGSKPKSSGKSGSLAALHGMSPADMRQMSIAELATLIEQAKDELRNKVSEL